LFGAEAILLEDHYRYVLKIVEIEDLLTGRGEKADNGVAIFVSNGMRNTRGACGYLNDAVEHRQVHLKYGNDQVSTIFVAFRFLREEGQVAACIVHFRTVGT